MQVQAQTSNGSLLIKTKTRMRRVLLRGAPTRKRIRAANGDSVQAGQLLTRAILNQTSSPWRSCANRDPDASHTRLVCSSFSTLRSLLHQRGCSFNFGRDVGSDWESERLAEDLDLRNFRRLCAALGDVGFSEEDIDSTFQAGVEVTSNATLFCLAAASSSSPQLTKDMTGSNKNRKACRQSEIWGTLQYEMFC